jgi:hypothetical protein
MTVQEYYIAYIDLDLYEIIEYRKNLKKFFALEIKKNKLLRKDYERILEELERITIQINELENKKSEILNLNGY